MMSDNFQVDIVIPWVDDSDPVWQEERAKYLGEFHENKKHLAHYFRDWDTLRYVFRSIEKNMPWIRKVHLITCGHLPKWLNLKAEKLQFHKHSDFFAEGTVLPTFSTRPIEMNLMNLPDVAEHFVYFNDDMIVTKPVDKSRFFTNGLPNDFFVMDIPRGGWLYDHIRVKEPYSRTVRNAIDLLNKIFPISNTIKDRPDLFFDNSYPLGFKVRNRLFKIFGIYKWIIVNHHPQPYLFSHLKECSVLFQDRIKEVRKHRFRDYTDLNQYLYRYYALTSRNFSPHYFGDGFCFVLASVKRYQKDRHYLYDKTFVCLNDTPFLKENEYPELKKIVISDLEKLFPKKSSFEL